MGVSIILRMFLRFAKNLTAAGVRKLGQGIAIPQNLQQSQRAHSGEFTRRLRNFKAGSTWLWPAK